MSCTAGGIDRSACGVCAGPIAGRARSYRGFGVWLGSCRRCGSLWERVLPAMGAGRSPQDLGCGLAERAPSRAEPAPTGIWGGAWIASPLWICCGSGFYLRWGRSGRRRICDVYWQSGPHRGQSPLPQGFGVWLGLCRRCRSIVGAGSTRDGAVRSLKDLGWALAERAPSRAEPASTGDL